MGYKEFLDKTPAFISLVSAVSLAVSVSYDWGYFRYLGISFYEAPTTISDHIRSTLIWLPMMTLSMFGILIFELFSRRVERGMTEDELIASSPSPKFTKAFRQSPYYFITALALVVPILLLFGVVLPLEAWQFSLVIIWFMFNTWLFSHPRIIERTSKAFFLVTRWAPAIIIFIVFQGAVGARNAKIQESMTYKISLKTKNRETIQAIQLRSFDRALLVWDKGKDTYEFIPWSTIARLERISSEKISEKGTNLKKSNKKMQPPANSGD